MLECANKFAWEEKTSVLHAPDPDTTILTCQTNCAAAAILTILFMLQMLPDWVLDQSTGENSSLGLGTWSKPKISKLTGTNENALIIVLRIVRVVRLP